MLSIYIFLLKLYKIYIPNKLANLKSQCINKQPTKHPFILNFFKDESKPQNTNSKLYFFLSLDISAKRI